MTLFILFLASHGAREALDQWERSKNCKQEVDTQRKDAVFLNSKNNSNYLHYAKACSDLNYLIITHSV